MAGIPRAERGQRDWLNALLYSVQSPPIVFGDTIVTPMSISTYNNRKEMPPGWMRGFDVRNGETKWTFHTIPQGDEFGNDTWGGDSWRETGKVGVWTMMSVDPELGYIYMPLNTAAPDYYGGHRPGRNLFSESLVAVDLTTGARVWHFPVVHHGLWDYDLPAAPNLLDVTVDGRPIKAVAQITKQGFTFVFDRATGEPVWPIEERPVPTDVEGELPWGTQPFPTRPAPFDQQGVTIDDLVDFTPEIREMAVKAIEPFRIGPLYTPHSLRGTVFRPGSSAGSWSGAAVDPETGILYVPSTNRYAVKQLREPEPGEPATLRYIETRPGARPQMPQGLPLFKPPYSRMTAIDMNTAEHVWMKPMGNGDRIRNLPSLRDLDLPPLGGDSTRAGPLLTKTLLIYALTTGGYQRPPAADCPRQGDGRRARLGRSPRRRHWCPDDLHGRCPPIHRRDRGRLAGAGTDCADVALTARRASATLLRSPYASYARPDYVPRRMHRRAIRCGHCDRQYLASRPSGDHGTACGRVACGQTAVRPAEVENPVALLHPRGGVGRVDGSPTREVVGPTDPEEVLEGGRHFGVVGAFCAVG